MNTEEEDQVVEELMTEEQAVEVAEGQAEDQAVQEEVIANAVVSGA